MKFSQRMGIKPLTKPIQIDSIDNELRVGLWNVYSISILSNLEGYKEDDTRFRFSSILWHEFFKWRIETIPDSFLRLKDILNSWFFSEKTNWYDVYDFLEFTSNLVNKGKFKSFCTFANVVLEREFAAFRFVDGTISPIINEHEIAEIESALMGTSNFTHLKGCNIHLEESLKLLSDKVNPNYRNSIKESISAVESVTKVIANNKNGELGTALNVLKEKANLSAGLVAGFKSIYGWTSNEHGIRHALMEEPNCDFDDAKYMLVSCSAFINYLISKAQKYGIIIN